MIKIQIRKLENEMTVENQKIHDKIAREIKSTVTNAKLELKMVEKEIKESIRAFQRQRARDKSDVDLMFKNQVDELTNHAQKLNEFEVNFKAIAIVNSMLIENINM